ncbi:hypothetical protein OIY81_2774 [Cryptosporidium canis]|nr:hypothetical protein OIY81_2774 [Cryptosporidium canis]
MESGGEEEEGKGKDSNDEADHVDAYGSDEEPGQEGGVVLDSKVDGHDGREQDEPGAHVKEDESDADEIKCHRV